LKSAVLAMGKTLETFIFHIAMIKFGNLDFKFGIRGHKLVESSMKNTTGEVKNTKHYITTK